MDRKAFYKLTSGLYIIGAQAGEKRAGCVVNTVLQVTSTPAQLLVAINKENFTCGVVKEAGRFSATVLAQGIEPRIIGTFGFATSADTDKFSMVPTAVTAGDQPYPSVGGVAVFDCKVVNTVDVGTHLLFIGEVEDSAVLGADEPLTYAYYHSVLKLKTPQKASSYNPDEE